MSLREDLQAAREAHDELAILEALIGLAQSTPLFADNHAEVKEWIVEGRDLAIRSVIKPWQEILQVIRSAEVFLNEGAARMAFDVATEACKLAGAADLPGLEDRAWMVQARALVRMGRQDDAVSLFHRISEHEIPPAKEDTVAPGLAFLAVGEAHLFEGRYEGAYQPLQRVLRLLPRRAAVDRLRYDALVGLGMLDHRLGEFETAAIRYEAAMELANKHRSRPEQVESLLLMGSLTLGLGRRVDAHSHLRRALALSERLPPAPTYLAFPTERLRNMVGRGSAAEMIGVATELARDCGAIGDLMGYVQLTVVVSAMIDYDGRTLAAVEMLGQVASGLAEGGQEKASNVLRRHLAGYRS